MQPLSKLMRRQVVAVNASTPAGEAAAVALASGVEHLLVFDWDALVGVASLSALHGAGATATVSDCMHVPAPTISASASVEQAVELMRSCDVTCLPVVAGGLILGVVTREQLGDSPAASSASALR